MTDDLIATVRAALAAATPGPWRWCGYEEDGGGYLCKCGKLWAQSHNEEPILDAGPIDNGDQGIANAALIASAPTWLAELCDRLENLEANFRLSTDGWERDRNAALARAEAAEAREQRLCGERDAHAIVCTEVANSYHAQLALLDKECEDLTAARERQAQRLKAAEARVRVLEKQLAERGFVTKLAMHDDLVQDEIAGAAAAAERAAVLTHLDLYIAEHHRDGSSRHAVELEMIRKEIESGAHVTEGAP